MSDKEPYRVHPGRRIYTFFVSAQAGQRWLYLHWNSFVARRHVHNQMEVFVVYREGLVKMMRYNRYPGSEP